MEVKRYLNGKAISENELRKRKFSSEVISKTISNVNQRLKSTEDGKF